MNEILGARLNTIHNLHFYLALMRELREAIAAGRLREFAGAFREERGAAPADEDAESPDASAAE